MTSQRLLMLSLILLLSASGTIGKQTTELTERGVRGQRQFNAASAGVTIASSGIGTLIPRASAVSSLMLMLVVASSRAEPAWRDTAAASQPGTTLPDTVPVVKNTPELRKLIGKD